MSNKFPYKYDVDAYIEKAIEKMKFTYPWVTRDMFVKQYSYSIEKIDGKYQYVSTYDWKDGTVDKRVHDINGEEFIDLIIDQNEYSVQDYNPVKEVFDVPIEHGVDAHGWTLEFYKFRSHVLGGYSSYVQAGDRTTGASREFFIPPSYFDGTYYEFLDKYCELVPGNFFGLYREDLENVPGLQEFLGF